MLASHASTGLRLALLLPCLTGLLGACAPGYAGGEDDSFSDELNRVPQQVRVGDKVYDAETEYLPMVVMCENPTAPPAALRAQAIAARTFMSYKIVVERRTVLKDAQADQVFKCSANKNGTYVSQQVRDAVAATAGKIMLHKDRITAGFFVSGAKRDDSCAVAEPTVCDRILDPLCKLSLSASTEYIVTINANKSGDNIRRAPRPFGDPTNPANRGAMGQNLANCMARRDPTLTTSQIIAYFYGSDVVIANEGPVEAVPTPPENDPAGQIGQQPAPDATSSPTTCYSYTLEGTGNENLPVGACVQSIADGQWWQCTDSGGFGSVFGGAGPAGPCTIEYSLPTP